MENTNFVKSRVVYPHGYNMKLHHTIVVLALLIATGLRAQDFEVAPVILEFDAEPSTNQMKIVNVKNHSNKPMSYIVSLSDFLPNQHGGHQSLPANTTKNSCANWITVNPSFFEVAPGGDIALQVSMLVPSDEYKTAWCTIYLQPSREQTAWSVDRQTATGIMVSGRIGVNVYQAPKSMGTYAVRVSNLQEVFSNEPNAPRRFSAVLENTGDRIANCKLFLMLSRLDAMAEGGNDERVDIDQMAVFPQMSRIVEFTLPEGMASGIYSLALLADYGARFPLEGAQVKVTVK